MQKAPKPRPIKLKVVGNEWLNHKVVKVDFEVLEPTDFDFIAGQHVSLRIGEMQARPYSIFSNLSDKKHFSIVVSAGHHGLGANFLKNLKPGDEITGLGPLGRFYIRPNHKPNIIFYASGTGLSPIFTILNQMVLDGVKSKISLHWGLHSKDDIMITDKLDALKSKLNFSYEIYLSKPPTDWNGNTGYVTKDLALVEDAQYYIFGVDEMVVAVKDGLKRLGVKEEDVIG